MQVFIHHKKPDFLVVINIHVTDVTAHWFRHRNVMMDVIYQESIDRINISIGRMVTVLRDAMPLTLLPTFRSNFLLLWHAAKYPSRYTQISRQPFTTRTRVRSRAAPLWICGKQGGVGAGFSPSTSAFPTHYQPTNAPYSYFIHLPWTTHKLGNWQPR